MQLVGHVPYNLAPIISLFLKRDVNKMTKKLIEELYGLEIPCEYYSLAGQTFARKRSGQPDYVSTTSMDHDKMKLVDSDTRLALHKHSCAWPSRPVTSALSIKPHPSIYYRTCGRGTIMRVWFPGVRYFESILR